MMTDQEMISCTDPGRQIERLRAIMHRLRVPGGCPWDAEQTHESLISNLIEETYETVAAIRENDDENFEEELGDLLLQVVFHAEIASENKRFDFDSIARGISDKLVHRHPHVFGDSDAEGSEAVLKQWEEIKRAEKGESHEPYLHGVGKGLPAMIRAVKLQKKAGKVGFDWPDHSGVVEKVREELQEVCQELETHQKGEEPSPELEAEIGDLLFVVANLARKVGVDPEVALELTNQKFLSRFSQVESGLQAQDITLQDATPEEMEKHWLAAKNAQG